MIAIGFLLFVLAVLWAKVTGRNAAEWVQVSIGVLMFISMAFLFVGALKWLWAVAP